MTDADHIRGVFERYVKHLSAGDVEGVVAMYHDDATVEDPIGSEPHRGREAIRRFYAASAGHFAMKLTGPVRVAGHEAAAPMRVLLGPEGARKAIDVIDLMTFDEGGAITSMRAFWSPDDIRPATADD